MKYYILSFMCFAALCSSAQTQNSSNGENASSTPLANNTQGYIIQNNGDIITITDRVAGKTYTFPTTDTLHYAMMRKIKAEGEARRQATAPEPKRENIVR